MEESRFKKLALKLLAAVSAGDVDRVMESDAAFGDADNWKPYGGKPRNWDRVGVQTSEPVGAFAELLINSIDAILMRKVKEDNLQPRGEGAPKSMLEAIEKFYPSVPEGRIARLKAGELTKIAEQSVLVGVKRATNSRKYPTYTIADFGEGQNAADFPKTLLSLGEDNKEGIPFVQGRFNMGSTGSITFCTRGDIRKGFYKFILSKRTLSDSDGNWGWTLLRTRKVQVGKDLPVVEYFCPGKAIPHFRCDEIRAFNHADIGVVAGGTIVKLYEYDIGPSSRAVDLGLAQGLTSSLLECALPIRIYDFDAQPMDKGRLRQDGIADRTFSGMKVVASDTGENIDLPAFRVAETEENPSLGKIRIYATGIKKLSDHMQNYPFRCFYTINGQAQAKERASILRKANLDDLRNHIIVQVDCNEMDKTAMSTIFKPDRERMNDIELSRELKRLVVAELKADEALQNYAKQIRQRRVTETIKDNEKGKELWNLLARSNPEIKNLLGIGGIVVGESDDGPGEDKYEGKEYPTKLNLLKPKDGVLAVPINTHRRIECETDADNSYLDRSGVGEFFWNASVKVRYSQKLRNGKLRITVWPHEDAQIGDSVDATFGFMDSSRSEPLKQTVKIVWAKEEKPTEGGGTGGGGTGRGKSAVYSAPNIEWVTEDGWGDYGFDEESGADCRIDENGVATIFVNKDSKHLRALLKAEREESDRELVTHLFGLGVGILTLAMHKKFSDKFAESETGWDDHIKYASSAISAYVVILIRKLGGKR